MLRSFYHLGRMVQVRREIETMGGLPGNHSAPVAWSTILMGVGGAMCFAALLPATPRMVLLLAGAPVAAVGLALALIEAVFETR